jgi:GAF domain-containing protein
LKERKYRVEIGSSSIIGWVSENNMARVASDVSEDPLHLKNELLPETRSEATVPISIGKLVLGVLDVQSTRASSFTPETVAMLQTLASQIAVAFQNSRLTETNQINFDEIVRLYRSSKMIAEAKTEDEVFKIGEQILKDAPYSSVILSVGANNLVAMSASYVEPSSIYLELPKEVETNTDAIKEYLKSGPVLAGEHPMAPPISLMQYVEKMNLTSSVYIPVKSGDTLVAVVILGSSQQTLSNLTIQPYASLVDVISATLGRIRAEKQIERHVRELESLTSISEAVSSSHDLTSFFEMLYAKVRQTIGDYAITVALYNARNNTISIPFSFENGELLKIEPFPLGEGLTSILIHSRQPLLLVENTEKRAAELGAMIRGKPAKSWMGVPLLVKNEPIGAMMLQDLENEFAFTEDDLKFLNTLAGQVAGAIQNVRLLEDSQRRAVQLETAAEIARDISGSLNLDELLIKAVNFIRERFDFYHAAIFLHDLPQEFAVIREATGEAGAQMKRAGYKIGIGSKSIVGYVTGRGEQLIVNDTMKDATYFANPFLPETRAEAAIPLKVGERILGALDVQSTQAYTFTDDNLRSLQILADQLAIAVVNTELFAETQEHLSQHRLLHHITTTVASGTTLEEALDSAVNGLQVTLGGDRVIIFLVDRERKKLEVKASVGYAEDVSKAEVLLGSGITGWVAQSRKPLRVKDVREDPRYVEISTNTRSELAIPLIYRNELLGVLNVESEQIDAYTENDEEMLGTLGGSLAAIIANARLLEQIRLQAERERLVNEVTSKIRRSTDIQSILTTTASELTRITGAIHTRIEIDPGKQD